MHYENVKPPEEIVELDFSVPMLGAPTVPSPIHDIDYTEDSDIASYYQSTSVINELTQKGVELPGFEKAGPRSNIYFNPAWTKVGIVTCGGLCPGINDVIKAIVNTLYFAYGVTKIYGIPYGYKGFIHSYGFEPMPLTPEYVDNIHEKGGSVLGASRGQEDTEEIVRSLDRFGINVLFAIGGDGTQRGAFEIAEMAREKGLRISVIGIPKTIDNDLGYMDRTFGFETAVYAASPVITAAHNEAKGAFNGIGLIHLMGRHSGFIAASATLANSFVNFCLIPEVPFCLDGEDGLLMALERRLTRKSHAVIVVAEGAGQELMQADLGKDASGNVRLKDVGYYLKDHIEKHLCKRNIDHTVKYFDPSYLVRSIAAKGTDAVYCLHLGRHAVHAAMSGKTSMVVGNWNNSFIHVPMRLAVKERNTVNPRGQFWQSVLNTTRQQDYFRSGG